MVIGDLIGVRKLQKVIQELTETGVFITCIAWCWDLVYDDIASVLQVGNEYGGGKQTEYGAVEVQIVGIEWILW